MDDQTLRALTVVGIYQSPEDDASPARLVMQDETSRMLEMPIGACEAHAVHTALQQVEHARPYTHDLLATLVERLEATVSRVVIDDVSSGTYYARVMLKTPDGPVSLDCRPSDGITLALLVNAPILAAEAVMAGEER